MTKTKTPKKSKRQLDHVVRRFYNPKGFLDGTRFIEYCGRGKINSVMKNGLRIDIHRSWSLKELIRFVKRGFFVEKSA